MCHWNTVRATGLQSDTFCDISSVEIGLLYQITNHFPILVEKNRNVCCFVVEKKLYLYKLTYSTERGEAKASHVSYKMNLPTGEEGGSNYDSFEGKRMKLVNVSV